MNKSAEAFRTIGEVAGELGITQQAYSKLEKQEWIDAEKMEKILKALKSSRKELENIKKFTHHE